MLANFFGKSKPVNFILITLLFLGYCLWDVFSQLDNVDILEVLFVIPTFLVVFFLYNFIISKNKLTKDNSYAFLLFVVGLGCLSISILDNKIIGIYLLLFLFLRRVYSLRTLNTIYGKLYDSGLWLGVLFLFSPYNLMYILLLYGAIFLFLKITIRTVLIPLLGLVTPVFLYFTFLFWNDDLEVFYKLFEIDFIFDLSFLSSNFYGLFLGVFGFFTLISILVRSGSVFSVSNKFKRIWVLLLLHFVIAILYMFMVGVKNDTVLIGVLIPSTFIITNWLQNLEKKWIVNGVLLLFLVLSFTIHFIV